MCAEPHGQLSHHGPYSSYQASPAQSAAAASLLTAVCTVWTIAIALYSVLCSQCSTCGLSQQEDTLPELLCECTRSAIASWTIVKISSVSAQSAAAASPLTAVCMISMIAIDCIALCAHNAQLADCHSKKTACLSLLRKSTRSAIASWTIVKISSVSSSIGCRSKSADCRVYDWSSHKREYTLTQNAQMETSTTCSYMSLAFDVYYQTSACLQLVCAGWLI